MKKIRVVIADDHAVVRTGLTALLGAERDIEVVGQARNGRDVIRLACDTQPDVVIMDLRMPEQDGAAATAELQACLPATRVLILTSFGEADGVGAITTTTEDTELVSVVRRIAAGETFISAEIQRLLRETPPVPKLTPRQHEILGYLVKGLTNREIARILKIREDSVEEHLNLLLAKIDASNRTEAVAIALRKHLL